MKRFIINTLYFSRAERNGFVVLVLVCAIVFAAPEMLRYLQPKTQTDFAPFQADVAIFRKAMPADKAPDVAGAPFLFDPNVASLEDFVRLGLSEKVAGTICNYRNKGGKFRKSEDFQKIWSLPAADYERLLPFIKLGDAASASRFEQNFEHDKAAKIPVQRFNFDPNTALEADFQQLGLPKRTIKGILNYRSKGGKFKVKEDFAKIYSLEELDYTRLAPYITITSVTAANFAPRPATYSTGSDNRPKYTRAASVVDINRSAMEDWLALPGIGDKRAQQIIRFRESLGGFLSIEQVGEMYGLPDSIFQAIKPMLNIAAPDVRKINLNTVSLENLDIHPYFSKKQATLVVNYRDQHGSFESINDVMKAIPYADKNWFEKVRPYLAVH